MSEPMQQETSNPGWERDFTCPGCYADLPYKDWVEKTDDCPECGRKVHCTRKMVPESYSELIEEEENDAE